MRVCVFAFVIALLLLPTSIFAQESSSAPVLREREPTLEQLTAYLWYYLPSAEGYESYMLFPRFYLNSAHDNGVRYVDLNGDGELDLVVEGLLRVAVMVWLGDRYSEPMQIYHELGPRNPFSKVSFEDWTNDGTPEVTFDYRSALGGTNVYNNTWYRYIVHCGENQCNLAWQSETADFGLTNGIRGAWDRMSLRRSAITHRINDYRIPIIEKTVTEFILGCTVCGLVDVTPHDLPYYAQYRVGESTYEAFVWNGTEFVLDDSRILSNARGVGLPVTLSAQGRHHVARMSVISPADPTFPRCHLLIDDIVTGESFLCASNVLEWRDLTGDGQEEVFVIALSGEYIDDQGDKNCIHQRLMAFTVDRSVTAQIANIAGCVVQSDLYGVRVENIDDDAALEIIAADELIDFSNLEDCIGLSCWYELNDQDEIYDWNGEQYEYVRTIPRAVGS